MKRVDDWHGSRREFLGAALVAAGALWWPRGAGGEETFRLPEATRASLAESPLVYVSPLRRDASESTCHGEVWFVPDGSDLLVVTSHDRWKARAVRKGLQRTRLWVGDFGVWKKGDRFKTGPSFLAEASFEADAEAIESALAAFGDKYTREWGKWEPRFRKGLADGSRVLIRYRPSGA
jgi:hypothetical protein